MLLWRWFMIAVRIVERFITWAHWARPRMNSSFQQERIKLVVASWLRKKTHTEKCDNFTTHSIPLIFRQFKKLLFRQVVFCSFTVSSTEQANVFVWGLFYSCNQWALNFNCSSLKLKMIPLSLLYICLIKSHFSELDQLFSTVKIWSWSFTFLPKSWEGGDGASPVHGEKKKPGCRLTDIMYIQILWHGARHRQLHRNWKARENYW